MTYPPSSSGYPSAQQPTTQFSAPTHQFGKVEQPSAQSPAPAAAGPSKLPFILLAAVAVLGLLVYLFSFGPQFQIESTDFPQLGSATGTSLGLGLAVVASLLSGLIAAASVLPRQKAPVGIIASVAVLAFLLVLAEIIQTPDGVSLGWALYVVIEETRSAAVRPVRRPDPVLRPARTAPRRRPAAASALPGPVRRRLLGWLAVRRWLRRPRPAERPADPADRFPDLRPAAVAVGADRPGPRAAAVVVVFVFVEPVRQLVVIISGLASVNTAHASKELLYR